ncbi:hypothetical protein ACJX0J_029240, partial [Zea mays]
MIHGWNLIYSNLSNPGTNDFYSLGRLTLDPMTRIQGFFFRPIFAENSDISLLSNFLSN